jgi:hypothetical protein
METTVKNPKRKKETVVSPFRALRSPVIALIIFVPLCCLSRVHAQLACVPPPSGMVGWWPGDGNANDIKGSNNGTLHGGVSFAPGMVGQAFSFDGASGYVDIPTSSGLPTSTWTVEFWFLLHNTGDQAFVTDFDGSGGRFVIELNPGDGLGLRIGHFLPGSPDLNTLVIPSTGVWHHLAAIQSTDGGIGTRLYLDGTVIGTGGPEPGDPTIHLKLGQRGNGTSFLNGLLDEVSVYNRVLSDGEIRAIFNAGNAGKCKGCQVNVTLLKQDKQPTPPWWGGLQYNHTAFTIGDLGCALTDFCMLLNYHGTKTNPSFNVTPDVLNTYLDNLDSLSPGLGYDLDGNINPIAIELYAIDNNIDLHYNGRVTHRDDQTLNSYLCSGDPVLLAVLPNPEPHWVLATGQTTANSSPTYAINDPADYANDGTLEGFTYPCGTACPSGNYLNMLLYSPSGSVPSNTTSLSINAYSPINLLLVDASGRRTGLDPLTGLVLNEIPNSSYVINSLGDDLHPGTSTPPVKRIEVLNPVAGNYTLEANGTGSGTFTLQFLAASARNKGLARETTAVGVINSGATSVYQLSYSYLTSGPPLTVQQIVSFQSTFADIDTSLQLGLIDNSGIANSLSEKIEAAQNANGPARNNILNAFKNEVNVQSGKHITGIAPQVLLQDGDSLIAQNR